MLFKEIVDGRTDGRTHARTDGRRTTDAGHWRITKAHLSTSCSGELKIRKMLLLHTVIHIRLRLKPCYFVRRTMPDLFCLFVSPSFNTKFLCTSLLNMSRIRSAGGPKILLWTFWQGQIYMPHPPLSKKKGRWAIKSQHAAYCHQDFLCEISKTTHNNDWFQSSNQGYRRLLTIMTSSSLATRDFEDYSP